jgi:flagellar biosynthesis protein FlhF
MKIKRYTAASMREGLAMVREEQGPDAVIVSSARIEGGVEIVAATDYDAALFDKLSPPRPARAAAAPEAASASLTVPAEPAVAPPDETMVPESPRFSELLGRLVQDAMRGRRPGVRGDGVGVPAAPQAAEVVERPAVVTGAAPTPATPPASAAAAVAAADRAGTDPALDLAAFDADGLDGVTGPDGASPRPQVVWSQDAAIVEMRNELQAMRHLLEAQMARLAWDDLALREPQRARVLRDLSALDIAPDLARRIATDMPTVAKATDVARLALALLLRHIAVVDPDPFMAGGVHALIGPTGAGKTTTIAKLAAQAALRDGRDAVALICTDNQRVGAREQLTALARVLGVPVTVATTAADLGAALQAHQRRRLVLIDTAGVTRRNLHLYEETALWSRLRSVATMHAVLPASGEAGMLAELTGRERGLGARDAIITKIDEATSLGPVLSAVIRAGLPLARLCDGPRVPEDLHDAAPRRVWLLKLAAKLLQETRRRADVQYLAQNFTGTVTNG